MSSCLYTTHSKNVSLPAKELRLLNVDRHTKASFSEKKIIKDSTKKSNRKKNTIKKWNEFSKHSYLQS